MPTLSQTDLDNAMRDAQDLGLFVNGAAGTVATRTGGTIPNLASIIATLLSYVTGTEIHKKTAGNVTATSSTRKVIIQKTVPEATTVTINHNPSARSGVPITIANEGTGYDANPTTVNFNGAHFRGGSSFVMDGDYQVATFWPLPDNSGFYLG